MKIPRLILGPRLGKVSWVFIELFTLLAVFFLPFSKSAADISIWIALVLWVLRKFPWNEPFPRLGPANAAVAVLLAAAALSFTQVPSEHAATAVRGLFKWLKHAGVFFMCAELAADPARAARLLGTFLASSFLAVLDGYYQMFSGKDLVKGYEADVPGRLVRMRGPFDSPNDLGSFLLAALPLWVYAWMKEGRWNARSTVYAAALILSGVALLATLSRSAVFALALSVLAYLAVRGPRRLILPFLALPAAAIMASPLLRANFITSLSPQDITIGERLRYWGVAWDMIRHGPFLGNGVNLFYVKFAEFAPAAESYRGYAHNCYLQLWAEMGLLGLAAFLAPVIWFFARGARRRAAGAGDALAVGAAALLLQSAADTQLYGLQTALLFWVLWGSLWGVRFFSGKVG